MVLSRGNLRRRCGCLRAAVAATLEPLESRVLLSVVPGSYTITDLGTLGGANSLANSINDSGQITGQADTGSGQAHAFLFSNGTMQDLGTLPGMTNSIGTAINAGGQVTGRSSVSSAPAGFFYNGGAMQSFTGSTSPLNQPTGINANGVITGYGPWNGGSYHPYTYDSVQGLVQIPLLAGRYLGNALGINDAGQVVGGNYNGSWTGYLYDPITGTHAIPNLGGGESNAIAINNTGQLTGFSTLSGGQRHAIVYTIASGSIIDIGDLGGNDAIAWSINDSGDVVGQSSVNGTQHAFVYASGGTITDLNTLVPANSGWVLKAAQDINNLGQIVGYGTVGGQSHAFLLSPSVPSPITPTVTVVAANTVYNGLAYSGASLTVNPAADTGAVSFTYYSASDILLTTPLSAPIDAGDYQVVGHVEAISGYTAADSAPVSFTISRAALSGFATTQDALNLAKQGSITIDLNGIDGLQNGDTVSDVFGSATFSLTIGANTYEFAPSVRVDLLTNTVHVTYALKNGTEAADTLRADLLALEAADGTVSTSASKTPYSSMWVTAASANYIFTDDFLTRLFSSK